MTMTQIRVRLISGLRENAPFLAELLEEAGTEIEPIESALLKTHTIYLVSNLTGIHPRQYYVAGNEAGNVFMLSGKSPAFIEMIRQEEISLENEQAAVEYFALFLRVTRAPGFYYEIVASTDDIPFSPEPDQTEQAARDDFIKRYAGIIRPPEAKYEDDEFIVTAYVVEGNNLERLTGYISPRGEIAMEEEVLEDDLPLVSYL